jgi:hypothetical protein
MAHQLLLLLVWITTSYVTSTPPPLSPQARRIQEVTYCPDSDGSSLDFRSSSLKIVRSTTLCTLVEVKMMGSERFIVPIGRSYSGKDWERAAGGYRAEFRCDDSGCDVDLPPLASDSTYQLTTFLAPEYSSQDVAARFLEQATFGPTRESIQDLLALNATPEVAMAQWVSNQQKIDYMSHRAIFRSRLNSKFEVPSPLGAVTQPCRAGTRYRKHMFSVKDSGKIVDFQFIDGGLVLGFDGIPSTVVAPQVYTYINKKNVPLEWGSGTYKVCSVSDDLYLKLDHPIHGDCTFVLFQDVQNPQVFEVNPSIKFAAGITPNPRNVINLPQGAFEYIDQDYFDYVIGVEDFTRDREIIVLKDINDPECSEKVFPKDFDDGPVLGLSGMLPCINAPTFVAHMKLTCS